MKLLAVKKKSNFYWGAEEQKAFEEAKRILGNNVLLAYPDFSKSFNVYLDTSDYQLGATVVQNGSPLDFYTRKLLASQKNYTVREKELLGIVERSKAFEGICMFSRSPYILIILTCSTRTIQVSKWFSGNYYWRSMV